MPWKVNFVITILIIIILAFIVMLTLMDRNNWKDFVVIIILVEAAKTTLQSKKFWSHEIYNCKRFEPQSDSNKSTYPDKILQLWIFLSDDLFKIKDATI